MMLNVPIKSIRHKIFVRMLLLLVMLCCSAGTSSSKKLTLFRPLLLRTTPTLARSNANSGRGLMAKLLLFKNLFQQPQSNVIIITRPSSPTTTTTNTATATSRQAYDNEDSNTNHISGEKYTNAMSEIPAMPHNNKPDDKIDQIIENISEELKKDSKKRKNNHKRRNNENIKKGLSQDSHSISVTNASMIKNHVNNNKKVKKNDNENETKTNGTFNKNKYNQVTIDSNTNSRLHSFMNALRRRTSSS